MCIRDRVVSVYDPAATADTVNPGNKIVYLTFDDGPGKYTQGLLAVSYTHLDVYKRQVIGSDRYDILSG